MFAMGFNKTKLKENLKLTINRLKLLEKKKTELALKARKEIADYVSNGKEDRARIQVEYVIREDYLVEAMEIIELYCDLLLARFGFIESLKCVDEGLEEAICSILWVEPRLSADIQELRVISDQLFMKYGEIYCTAAQVDEHDVVNQRLIIKMSPQPPSKSIVENYLIEIAKSHNVPFEPDPTILFNPQPPMGGMAVDPGHLGFTPYPPAPAPPYTSIDPAYPPPAAPSAPEKSGIPSVPDLPSVASTLPTDIVGKGSDGGEDVDFDDLTKRFEELKKK